MKNYTPREAAYEVAIGWLREAHEGHTADLANFEATPSEEKRVKDQIAKLHNRLLQQSGMDGLPLHTEGKS